MNAKTTLSQEFSDSKWVVRAGVTAADNHWSDEDEPWTIYHLKIRATYKGTLPSSFELFTYRDSGGFYLDEVMKADVGGEYLLFLEPMNGPLNIPIGARVATEVNYNCGQSRAWASITKAHQHELSRLARTSN